jgi:hypothetical protein
MNPGVFEAFYQSPLQHPILLWISNLFGTGLALLAIRRLAPARRRPIQNFVLLWALISTLDAWLSANHVYGFGSLPGGLSSIIPFLFVWAGDYRIFIAMDSRIPSWRGVAASLVVPILAGALTLGQTPRILFLTYELMFMAWILLYGKLTKLDRVGSARRIRNLALTFYSLWVIADLLILILPVPTNDLGFAVRVIPNLIYYGAFGLVCGRAWSAEK